MLDKLKVILYTFVCVTTCVVFGTAVFIKLFLDTEIISADILWQILLVSFLCSAFSGIYQKDGSNRRMKLLACLHYVEVNLVVLGCGIWFKWFRPENLVEVVGMLLIIAVIFVIVSVVVWQREKRVAEQMNERLKAYQTRREMMEEEE